jgi:hypothetical protein
LTHPNQRNSSSQVSVPEEVVIAPKNLVEV